MEITNDISTRLLAQENLLINRAPVPTASFDVKSRILTLPMWKNMTPEIEEMLKAHEVGHALYTDEELFTKFQENNPTKIPFGYLNILEDVRIEKLMKRKYPGLRKTFTVGYTELNQRNFFAVQNRNLSDLLLIDRINLYYKIGFKSGVKFSTAEKYLVEKIDRLESVADVFTLAASIYEFVKRENERKKQERENDTEYKKLQNEKEQEEQEDLEEIHLDNDMFDDDDWSEGTEDFREEEEEDLKDRGHRDHGFLAGNTPEQIEEESLESQTADAFARALAESADITTEYVYVSMPSYAQCSSIKVDYKTVLKETTEMLDRILDMSRKAKKDPNTYYYAPDVTELYNKTITNYEAFRTDTNRIVNYLVKEFEMKKAATNYKRQSVAKTGVLDTRKLASYKIREDLFKQITITKDGMKHGMIFTIDWSGSMTDYLEETVKQLISLVTFCYRCKIPFEVYAFSDNILDDQEYITNLKNQLMTTVKPFTVELPQGLQMIELFNSKATVSEFQRMCRNLYLMSSSGHFRNDVKVTEENAGQPNVRHRYELNGTPLNEAVAWLYDYIDSFKSRHQVEKLTMIKLTDGEGGGVHRYYGDTTVSTHYGDRLQSHSFNEKTYTEAPDGKRYTLTKKGMLRDLVTKKIYQFDPYEFTNTVCAMIQDRYNASVVGYHVLGRGRRELMQTASRYGIARNFIEEQDFAIKIRKGFNDEMFYPLTQTGHNELFLLPNTIKIADNDLDDDMSQLTSNQIAKKFGKYLGAKKTSRVLLNRFVNAIA